MFTYQCIICKEEQPDRGNAVRHLQTHTKGELVEALAGWGYYDHE